MRTTNTSTNTARFLACVLLLCSATVATAQTPAGSADLTWQPPTTNTNGTPLTDLSGFKVYWGTVLGTYTNSTTLNNPGLTGVRVTGLSSGQKFFVVTALNSVGGESAFSNVASKVVTATAANPPVQPVPTTVGGLVFTLQTTNNATLMPEVGSVAAGVPCDPMYQHVSNGTAYMLVAASRVTPLPGAQITAAWTVCR